MNFDRVFSGDALRLVVSAVAGYWLLGWLLSFYAALVVGGGVLLFAAGAGAWVRKIDFRKENNRLLTALMVVAAFASLGFSNEFYWWVIHDGLGINTVHWFSFWVAVAGIVLFYYRTKYQGKQIDIQIREQIDDRFNAAVTLLGNGRISARTGAIYSLYHLAVEDEKYRKEVAQILCSHIRSKTQEYGYDKGYEFRPSNEIQTAINLLFRNVNSIEGLYKHSEISAILSTADLSRAYLVGADLSGGYLAGAEFIGTICREADFSEAQCQGVIFEDAKCQKADFSEAHCQGAIFESAKCQKADFKGAYCQNTGFNNAHCQGASFGWAQCHNAIFQNTKCHSADFESAECQGAIFEGARCFGANFSNAKCQGADFGDAYCQGANFYDANCKGAYTIKRSFPFPMFMLFKVETLRDRIGKPTEFETAVFSGGLSSTDVKEIEEAREYLSDDEWERMEKIIEANKGEISYEVPQDSGMITGVLKKAEIQQVIDDAKRQE